MPDHNTLSPNKAKRGGRPPRDKAERIADTILDCATELFFSNGYGSTSIEAIAARAGISKRTFYARFADKADLFRAVVHRIVTKLRPADPTIIFGGKSCEENLHHLAHLIIHAVVSPQALALHRLIIAEASRFPELTAVGHQHNTRQEAVHRIADMLKSETRAGHMSVIDTNFAAEQFMQMVISLPQRRALGFGKAMTTHELDVWARKSVRLFLDGCKNRDVSV